MTTDSNGRPHKSTGPGGGQFTTYVPAEADTTLTGRETAVCPGCADSYDVESLDTLGYCPDCAHTANEMRLAFDDGDDEMTTCPDCEETLPRNELDIRGYCEHCGIAARDIHLAVSTPTSEGEDDICAECEEQLDGTEEVDGVCTDCAEQKGQQS